MEHLHREVIDTLEPNEALSLVKQLRRYSYSRRRRAEVGAFSVCVADAVTMILEFTGKKDYGDVFRKVAQSNRLAQEGFVEKLDGKP